MASQKIIDAIFDRSKNTKPLFIFEMANNHMGDLDHGINIIKEFRKVSQKFNFNFAFKLQFRDLDTFIHPDYRQRMELKYIKRFSETRLTNLQLKSLKDEISKNGFISICTPFDEKSVDLIEELNFDIIKIASCSFTDWPLLEKIAKTSMPIIASTAGASLQEIDSVVNFFQHRMKNFSILHCVGEYPTPDSDLQLNQIDLLKNRYPNLAVGYSTHEEPDNYESIKIAISKGAKIFEKHVGIKTEKYALNSYSATPEMVKEWLESAKQALKYCGVQGIRHKISEKESADLRQFKRGVFANRDIAMGEKINLDSAYLAFPNEDGQIVANDLSKYLAYTAITSIKRNAPILFKNVKTENSRENIREIILKMRKMLEVGNILIPGQLNIEISHHYGLDKFEKFGAILINVINREYAKKLVIVMPNQTHPAHLHKKKEETFHILYGELIVNLDGKKALHKAGDVITVERGVLHSFSSKNGGIFEEVSTTHYKDDSFYLDSKIVNNKNRKTYLTYWVNL